jgi:hypothetical protein
MSSIAKTLLAVVVLITAAALAACETSGQWSEDASQTHLAAVEGLSSEVLAREAERVLNGGESDYAPAAYVLYAFADQALASDNPRMRDRGMAALMLAAAPNEQSPGYELQPRAGQVPLVLPASKRSAGLPEAQYRLYQEWIDKAGRETEALLMLMEAALADYPPALAAWEAEERAGRFEEGGR